VSTSRRLQAAGVALASVLLLGGCAAGTHPGAAAVVGKTEITVGDLEKNVDAISGVVKQQVPPSQVLTELLRSELANQVIADHSVTVTEAEIAPAMKVLVDEGALPAWEANPVSKEFLRQAAIALIGRVKLGGGTGLTDPTGQAKAAAGQQIVDEDSKSIKVDVSPRYGKWTGTEVNGKESGSLSILSDQSAAAKTPAPSEQPQQGDPQQPQQGDPQQPEQPQPQG
jgi:hypothetical protein